MNETNPPPAPGTPKLNLDFGSGKLTMVTHCGVPCVLFRSLCEFIGADHKRMAERSLCSGFMHGIFCRPDGAKLLAAHLVPLWLATLEYGDVGEEHRHAHREWVIGAAEPRQLFRAPAAGAPKRFDNGVRLTEEDLVPMSIAERQALPRRVLHAIGQATRLEHQESLKAQGYTFVAVDDRFADEPDYDPITGLTEIWQREIGGVVEYAEIWNSGTYDDRDFTPPEACWVILISSYDPRLIEY